MFKNLDNIIKQIPLGVPGGVDKSLDNHRTYSPGVPGGVHDFFLYNKAYPPGVPGYVHEHVTNNYTYSVGIPGGLMGTRGDRQDLWGAHGMFTEPFRGLCICAIWPIRAPIRMGTHGDVWIYMRTHGYKWLLKLTN